jgi:polar amino acid transport system substrate-binding protein
MKWNVLSSSLGVLALLAMSFDVRAKTTDDIRVRGEIRLGMSADFEPFYYVDNGVLKGFEIDLGNALAAQLGVKASWKKVAFDSLFPALNDSRLDAVIASHSITAEREKLVAFTKPHYCTGLVILTRPWGPRNLEALKGKTVGAVSSTAGRKFAAGLKGLAALVSFASENEAITALQRGRVQALIVGRLIAAQAIRKGATSGVPMALSSLLTTDRVGIAVQKSNPSLREALNRALRALELDGTYKRLSLQYFGTDIRCS